LLLPQTLIFPAQPIEFGGIAVDFSLLNVLPMVLPHQLVTDQRACYESHWSADERPNRSMTYRAADDSACSCTHAAADQASLLAFS
jgi:hypothetical protein